MGIVRRVIKMYEKKVAAPSAAQIALVGLRLRIQDQLEAVDEWHPEHNLSRSTFCVLKDCLRWLESPEPPK